MVSRGNNPTYGYGSIPINTIFNGMNIHLPAILGFTRGTRFWHTAISRNHFTSRFVRDYKFTQNPCTKFILWFIVFEVRWISEPRQSGLLEGGVRGKSRGHHPLLRVRSWESLAPKLSQALLFLLRGFLPLFLVGWRARLSGLVVWSSTCCEVEHYPQTIHLR